jgi:hypothetical protein
VLGIPALTPDQRRAAFGTNLTPLPDAGNATHRTTTPTSSVVALPILPTCGPGPCWRGATTGVRHIARTIDPRGQ